MAINQFNRLKFFPPQAAQAFFYDWRASFFYGFFQGAVLLFLTFTARKIQATPWQVAIITSSHYLGYLLTFFWSYISTGKRKMPFIFWTKCTARALFIFMFFTTQPSVYVLICLLYFVLEAGGTPAFGGFYKSIYHDQYRPEIIGYLRTIVAATTITTCFFVGYLLDSYGIYSYRYIFPIGGIAGVISIWIFKHIKLAQETTWKEKTNLIKIFQQFIKDKHILILELILFIAGFGKFMAAPLYPLFLVDILKITNLNVGQLGTLSSLSSMLTYLYLAPAMSKRNLVGLMKKSVLLLSLVPLIYFISHHLGLIYLATIISGMALSGWDLGEYNYILQTAKERHVQHYSSLQFTLLGIRGISASFVGIAVMNLVGLRNTFLIIFTLMLLSFLLMHLYQKRTLKTVDLKK